MLRIFPYAAIVAGSLWSSALAQQADPSGEYPGVYVMEGSRVPVSRDDYEMLELKCVLAPGVMREMGRGTGYFLDMEAFQLTGTVSYLKGNEYFCSYSDLTKTENCESTEFSAGTSFDYSRYNIYSVFTSKLQRGNTLMTEREFRDWMIEGRLNPQYDFAYHRCDCISDEMISSHLSPSRNMLSSKETGQRSYWEKNDPTGVDYQTARDVLKVLGGCASRLSS